MKLRRVEALDQRVGKLANAIGNVLVDGFHYLALFPIGSAVAWSAVVAFVGDQMGIQDEADQIGQQLRERADELQRRDVRQMPPDAARAAADQHDHDGGEREDQRAEGRCADQRPRVQQAAGRIEQMIHRPLSVRLTLSDSLPKQRRTAFASSLGEIQKTVPSCPADFRRTCSPTFARSCAVNGRSR